MLQTLRLPMVHLSFRDCQQATSQRGRRLVFLRWTRHFAVILTLSDLAACAVSTPSLSQAQQQPTQPRSREAGERASQPSIEVGVSTPKPDPGKEKREEAREGRNVVAQETVAKFTGALFVLALVQFLVTAGGLYYAAVAANAAKKSADAADVSAHVAIRTLQIASRPSPDLVECTVSLLPIARESEPGVRCIGVNGVIVNTSGVPTRISDVRFSVMGQPYEGSPVAELVPYFLRPGAPWQLVGEIFDLSADEFRLLDLTQRTTKPLVVRCAIDYTDRFGKSTFTRTCRRYFQYDGSAFVQMHQMASDDDTLDEGEGQRTEQGR